MTVLIIGVMGMLNKIQKSKVIIKGIFKITLKFVQNLVKHNQKSIKEDFQKEIFQ